MPSEDQGRWQQLIEWFAIRVLWSALKLLSAVYLFWIRFINFELSYENKFFTNQRHWGISNVREGLGSSAVFVLIYKDTFLTEEFQLQRAWILELVVDTNELFA